MEKSLSGYKLFLRDKLKFSNPNDINISKNKGNIIITINKEILNPQEQNFENQWILLSDKMKKNYKMRQEAEKHIKDYLRKTGEKEDYKPINKYAEFVQNEIESQKIKKCNTQFFYEVFQKWIKKNKKAIK